MMRLLVAILTARVLAVVLLLVASCRWVFLPVGLAVILVIVCLRRGLVLRLSMGLPPLIRIWCPPLVWMLVSGLSMAAAPRSTIRNCARLTVVLSLSCLAMPMVAVLMRMRLMRLYAARLSVGIVLLVL